ncbi:mPR-like GPCR protein [Elsinoe ampelina]|uniref:MPR-like GPCR protein n=1 Tax=Elsinoe ampelina TaxID=302913 RepID=A0A6A6GC26_9PEZI|nr:mPR-like GPCR protein [Elsinoe ampelina]
MPDADDQKRLLSTDSSERHSTPQGSRRLVKFEDIPPWYQENEFIQAGYRPVSGSIKECFQSWTYIHNETFNIFSHLVPAALTVSSLFGADRLFLTFYPQANLKDRAVLTFYLLCVSTCFGLSALYHTMMNHSARYSHTWGNVDYCGIMVLIFGDFITGEYVGFYCEPHLQNLYWTLITSFTAMTAYIVLNPKYQSPAHRLLRLFSFTSLGLSAFAPIVHALILFDAQELALRSGLNYYYAEGAIVLMAVIIYACRYPEKASPGSFDTWGASHGIFHVLVVVATMVHFRGVWTAYEVNYNSSRC